MHVRRQGGKERGRRKREIQCEELLKRESASEYIRTFVVHTRISFVSLALSLINTSATATSTLVCRSTRRWTNVLCERRREKRREKERDHERAHARADKTNQIIVSDRGRSSRLAVTGPSLDISLFLSLPSLFSFSLSNNQSTSLSLRDPLVSLDKKQLIRILALYIWVEKQYKHHRA